MCFGIMMAPMTLLVNRVKKKDRLVSETAFFVQNNRDTAPNHEIRGCRLHPKTMRNIAPLGWLTSIANNRFKSCLLYLLHPGPLG
ncbi:hypothetical protein A4249_07560 [Brevundimonas sp. GW460-12-10-14-LB2]|nr:hypothetical protein A4249_07560 [Brevundimonas sp. GW460-12-10-14-LB2]